MVVLKGRLERVEVKSGDIVALAGLQATALCPKTRINCDSGAKKVGLERPRLLHTGDISR